MTNRTTQRAIFTAKNLYNIAAREVDGQVELTKPDGTTVLVDADHVETACKHIKRDEPKVYGNRTIYNSK